MDEILAWLAARAAEIIEDEADTIMVADRLAAASALDAAAFASEVIDLARVIGESVQSEADFRSLGALMDLDTEAGQQGVVLLSAVAQAIGIGRVSWPSRQAARKARGGFVALAHQAYAVAARLGPDLYAWLAGLVSVAVRLVSDRAATATPIVNVETGIAQPSTVLAYRLYGDAKRAAGLVDISGSATPLIMPARFEALAS
ncbi:MAG: hypothetical protein JWR80_8012 [Bradyrhizobium sp.]|nr:hypothetical protein [Bradyrhizobium sp.]